MRDGIHGLFRKISTFVGCKEPEMRLRATADARLENILSVLSFKSGKRLEMRDVRQMNYDRLLHPDYSFQARKNGLRETIWNTVVSHAQMGLSTS